VDFNDHPPFTNTGRNQWGKDERRHQDHVSQRYRGTKRPHEWLCGARDGPRKQVARRGGSRYFWSILKSNSTRSAPVPRRTIVLPSIVCSQSAAALVWS